LEVFAIHFFEWLLKASGNHSCRHATGIVSERLRKSVGCVTLLSITICKKCYHFYLIF